MSPDRIEAVAALAMLLVEVNRTQRWTFELLDLVAVDQGGPTASKSAKATADHVVALADAYVTAAALIIDKGL